jgi:hypothetical protein
MDAALANSPFGNLPPELRNQIYEFAFIDTTLYWPRKRPSSRRQRAPTALLKTCKQIRREARGIMYHTATLYIDTWWEIFFDVLTRLSNKGTSPSIREAFRHVVIPYRPRTVFEINDLLEAMRLMRRLWVRRLFPNARIRMQTVVPITGGRRMPLYERMLDIVSVAIPLEIEDLANPAPSLLKASNAVEEQVELMSTELIGVRGEMARLRDKLLLRASRCYA